MSIYKNSLELLLNESSNETFSYKSLLSMVNTVGGKRDTWRNLFLHEDFKSFFEIEHKSNGGMKIKTNLSVLRLKTLFALYKKNVSSRLKAEAVARRHKLEARRKEQKGLAMLGVTNV